MACGHGRRKPSEMVGFHPKTDGIVIMSPKNRWIRWYMIDSIIIQYYLWRFWWSMGWFAKKLAISSGFGGWLHPSKRLQKLMEIQSFPFYSRFSISSSWCTGAYIFKNTMQIPACACDLSEMMSKLGAHFFGWEPHSTSWASWNWMFKDHMFQPYLFPPG